MISLFIHTHKFNPRIRYTYTPSHSNAFHPSTRDEDRDYRRSSTIRDEPCLPSSTREVRTLRRYNATFEPSNLFRFRPLHLSYRIEVSTRIQTHHFCKSKCSTLRCVGVRHKRTVMSIGKVNSVLVKLSGSSSLRYTS